jgi:hypothetical protein
MADYDFSDLTDFSSDTSDFSSGISDLPRVASNFKTIGYILSGLMSAAGLFFSYEMIFTSDWGFDVEWNMFKSPLIYPLWLIGLVIAVIRFGKTHWSYDEVIETEDSWGNKKLWVNNDLVSWMFSHIAWPIIGHLFIEPLMYAALIYYPLMCILYFVGAFLPYILTIIVAILCIGSFKADMIPDFPFKNIILTVASLLFTSGFTYGGWAIMDGHEPSVPTPVEIEQDIKRNVQKEVKRIVPQTSNEVDESEFEDSKPATITGKSSTTEDINEDDFE